jgi:hypothetical protein
MDVDVEQSGYLDVAGQDEGTYDELPPTNDMDSESEPEEGTYEDTLAYDSQEADLAFENDDALTDDSEDGL